jgi:hypothetical protein
MCFVLPQFAHGNIFGSIALRSFFWIEIGLNPSRLIFFAIFTTLPIHLLPFFFLQLSMQHHQPISAVANFITHTLCVCFVRILFYRAHMATATITYGNF